MKFKSIQEETNLPIVFFILSNLDCSVKTLQSFVEKIFIILIQ